MSVQSKFSLIHSSSTDIFYNKPAQISYTSGSGIKLEDGSDNGSNRVEALIKTLNEKGPLVAYAVVGPKYYETAPDVQFKVHNQTVHGWKPGSKRVESTNPIAGAISYSVITILGAKKDDDKELVFFSMSTQERLRAGEAAGTSLTATAFTARSTNDEKIYVTSYKAFKEHVSSMFAPSFVSGEGPSSANTSSSNSASTSGRSTASSSYDSSTIDAINDALRNISFREMPRQASSFLNRYQSSNVFASASPTDPTSLSGADKVFVGRLNALDLNSILDNGPVEASSKAIGQEIFDTYKNQAEGDTEAGRAAVKKICNALSGLRKQYVEYSWDGVGDAKWKWQH